MLNLSQRPLSTTYPDHGCYSLPFLPRNWGRMVMQQVDLNTTARKLPLV